MNQSARDGVSNSRRKCVNRFEPFDGACGSAFLVVSSPRSQICEPHPTISQRLVGHRRLHIPGRRLPKIVVRLRYVQLQARWHQIAWYVVGDSINRTIQLVTTTQLGVHQDTKLVNAFNTVCANLSPRRSPCRVLARPAALHTRSGILPTRQATVAMLGPRVGEGGLPSGRQPPWRI